MIVGPESKYLPRCLDSVQGLYDELCIVFARGNQPDDGTEAIAARYGAKTGVYHNRYEHSGWPHVDDFAAARNLSFDLATSDYCMWLDADDVLQPRHRDALRKLVDDGPAEIVNIAYNTGNGNFLVRPRIIKRGVGRWIHPIHETIGVDGKFTTDTRWDIWVDHEPGGMKNTSLDRNLRMLGASCSLAARNFYYYQQDHFLSGQHEKGLPLAKAALALPGNSDAERYEIAHNIAQMESTIDQKEHWAWEAIKIDPRRREAWLYLAYVFLDARNPAKALAAVRCANALPIPEPRPWNHKRVCYEWYGDHIYWQILRANEMHDEAERLENESFDAAGAKFTLIHPTRGRERQALNTRSEWFHLADDPRSVEHIFGVDSDDAKGLLVFEQYRRAVTHKHDTVGATNAAAAISRGKILVYISDDIHPCKGWDTLIWAKLKDRLTEPAVLAVSDGTRTGTELMTVNICTRIRYEDQGWFFHPEYESMYADNDWTVRAVQDQCVVDGREIVLRHDHPYYTTGKLDADETYARTNAPERYERGLATFRKLHPDRELVTA